VLVRVSRPASLLPSTNKEHSTSRALKCVCNCRHSGRLGNGHGTDSHAQSIMGPSFLPGQNLKDRGSNQHRTAVQQVNYQIWGVCVSSSLRSEVKSRDV